MNKKYFNKFGVAVTESVGIAILVTCAIIAAMYFLKGKVPGLPGFSVEDREYRELMKKDKAEAKLVIIGRIAKKSAEIDDSFDDAGDPVGLAFGYIDFIVESVERGHYPYERISVYFGWASRFIPPETFPWGTKKDYKVGDRVRAFLSFGVPGREGVGPDRECYFTGLAYLSLEPLKNPRQDG